MKLLSLDLELNINQDDGNTPTSKTTDIIQIGAVILDTNTGNIVDTFERLCTLNTKINGELRLSKYIVGLTGITDQQISERAIPLLDAYFDLISFCSKHQVSPVPLTWGSGDMNELRDQLRFYFDAVEEYHGQEFDPKRYELRIISCNSTLRVLYPTHSWGFSKYKYTGFFDAKKMYQTYRIANNKKVSGGLRKAANSLQLTLPPNQSYHNAVSDAYMTALVYYKLMNMFKES